MDISEFQEWYVRPIEELRKIKNAGFPQMLISLPLLERYLRNKAGIFDHSGMNEKAINKLMDIFPELENTKIAWEFWHIYRNGLLHRVTMSRSTKYGKQMPYSELTTNIEACISYDNENEAFSVNPDLFSEKVLQSIQDNYEIFSGPEDSEFSLPKVIRASDFDSSAYDPDFFRHVRGD